MNENEKNIRGAVDSIQPVEGAKERMLNNIKQKAAAQTEAKQNTNPIKISKIIRWAVPVAACFALLLVGVKTIPMLTDKPPVDTSSSGLQDASPIMSVNSAEEITERLGIEIDAPEGAEGVFYAIIDGNIAEVQFTVDGNLYYLRASAQSGDLSGLYGKESAPEIIDSENSATISGVLCGDLSYCKIRWTDGKTNFSLVGNRENADKIKEIYEQIK